MTGIPTEPIEVIDSHTEGEPTRVVVGGWPVPAGATVHARRETMRARHDAYRRAVVLEPRGHDAIVGALLVPPDRPEAATGVVFFNDASWLGMCGHGTIGVVRTLHHLGRIVPGPVELDTPVGPVGAILHDDGSVTVRNVPSYLHRAGVVVDVPGLGAVIGDVAWGGNWFFLTSVAKPAPALRYEARAELLQVAGRIRAALRAQGVTGADGAEIDHIELFGPPDTPGADSRNFVLCPGAAYDRSPCGTGTSAKMAVLHAQGRLALGDAWVQESIIGSRFTGWMAEVEGTVLPHIRGRAWITGTSVLRFDPSDPFRAGLG
ncbi:MAG TPA: proline racemase family protein [Gemmatimonadales bacterium]|nr:proline racemase family protein [Gemmatimonadales bacterium]